MKPIVRWSSQLLAVVLLQPPILASAEETKSLRVAAAPQFAAGNSALRIPFELVGNHIYLRGRINGSEPLWLLLDTGATASYLDLQAATALGLGAQGESVSVTLGLPGVRLTDQALSVQPMGLGIYDGHTVGGLLGYDFISRFVVDIDYINQIIHLHGPRNYQYRGSGETIPLVMLEDDSGGKVPLVRVTIVQPRREPIEGNFIADIAVRSAVSFNTPFLEKHALLEVTPKTIEAALGGGTMVRESKQRIGRLPGVQMGRFTIENPVAIFFQVKQGILASPEFDGVIGGEILRRFRVVFDYSRQHMILEPNRHFSEPFEHDMSGMLLVSEGAGLKTIKIKQLTENSPATAAGLQEGDVIAAVDGKTASLEQMRRMFLKPGQSYRLSVKRGDQEVQTRIRMKRLI